MEKKTMSTKRRVKGEGGIYFDENRKEYIGTINNGKKADGSPNIKKFYSGKNGKKSDVVKKMTAWRLRHQGDYASTHDIKLSEAILAWAEICKKPDLKPSSYDRLESIIRCQIIPRIGWRYVHELSDVVIRSELIAPIMDQDELSVSTAKKAYNALNAYLKYAVYTKVIQYHPMAIMKAPKKNKSIELNLDEEGEEVSTELALNRAEMKQLQSVLYTKWKTGARRFINGAAVDLVLNTGLRMGEALALKWDDVNFEKKTVSVNKNLVLVRNRGKGDKKYKLILQDKPKTEKGKRIIPLNTATISALEDLKACPGYHEHGFIIHTRNGNPVLPRVFEQMLELMCKAAGIRKIGVHALRHTYATRLFENGVDIKVISELLGHSSTEITYRIYIHVIDSLKEEAVQALEL